jgi:drug/metabolite transporter (DMT)-like permease
MALGFVGLVWLYAPWENASGQSVSSFGVFLLLLACVSWAIGTIYSRHVLSPAPPFVAASLQMRSGSAALGLAAFLRGEPAQVNLAAIPREGWIAFIYLILIGSLVGFSTFVWLLKHSTPSRVATYAYVNPVVAVFLGWLILHEPVSPRIFFAAATIVAAVIIVTTQKGKRSGPPPAQKTEELPPVAKVLRS